MTLAKWHIDPGDLAVCWSIDPGDSHTGLSRVTVRRYVEAAEAAGLQPGGPEPSEERLARLATLSLAGPRQAEAPSEEQLAPWAEQIEGWLTADRLQVTRVQELLAERGCEVSYTSLRRFIERRGWRRRQPVTVRMEDGTLAHRVRADRGLALLASLLRLAHHQPAVGSGDRGPGGGMGLLRGRAPLPRHRQLPGCGRSSGAHMEVQAVQRWSRIGPNPRARLLRSAVSPAGGSVRKQQIRSGLHAVWTKSGPKLPTHHCDLGFQVGCPE